MHREVTACLARLSCHARSQHPRHWRNNRMNRHWSCNGFSNLLKTVNTKCVSRNLIREYLRETSWWQWYSTSGYFCTVYLYYTVLYMLSPILFLEMCKITPNLICKLEVLSPKLTQEFRWCMYPVDLLHRSPGEFSAGPYTRTILHEALAVLLSSFSNTVTINIRKFNGSTFIYGKCSRNCKETDAWLRRHKSSVA